MYTSNSVPCTPTAYNETDYVIVREVNYAELDLDPARNDNGNYLNGHTGELIMAYPFCCFIFIKISGTTTQKPTANSLAPSLQESPSLQKKSYATIDFPKTIALSQSINPKADMEEGSRKTRHNSTINSFSD